MSNIGNISFTINCDLCYLWQYDKAENLVSVLKAEESFLSLNVTNFWEDWFNNVFNLKTANTFGLETWGKVLGVPRYEYIADQRWSFVAFGSTFSCAIDIRGYLYTWGDNTFGELGLGITGGTHYSPEVVMPNADGTAKRWSYVSCSKSSVFTVAIDANNELWSWGTRIIDNWQSTQSVYNTPVKSTISKKFVAIECGQSHCMALDADGKRYIVGDNDDGQLGTDDTEGINALTDASDGIVWEIIDCGQLFSAGIEKETKKLYTWGYNGSTLNILGRNDNSTYHADIGEVYPLGKTWKKVSCGYEFCAAIDTDGHLFTAGANGVGQRGLGQTLPTDAVKQFYQVGTKTWQDVFCGGSFAFALDTDGYLWGWGENNGGQLGIGNTEDQFYPVKIAYFDWDSCSCGAGHTGFFNKAGALYACGQNGFGQLGTGDKTARTTLTKIYFFGSYKLKISDDLYRRILLGETYKMNINGSLFAINEYLKIVFGNKGVFIKNMPNGTMTAQYIVVSGENLTEEEIGILGNKNFAILPSGVDVNAEKIDSSNYLGFVTTTGIEGGTISGGTITGGTYTGDYSGFNGVNGGTQSGGVFYM